MEEILDKKSFKRAYTDIVVNCNNEKSKCFKLNKEKGISISEDWSSYEDFERDMYDKYIEAINKYGKDNIRLARYNSSLDYGPNNCYWISIGDKKDPEYIIIDNIRYKAYYWNNNLYTVRQMYNLFADSSFTYERFNDRIRRSNGLYVDCNNNITSFEAFIDQKYRESHNFKNPINQISNIKSKEYASIQLPKISLNNK